MVETLKNITNIDYSKISNIKIEGIDINDWPDFCDAYISEAEYNGVPMTLDEIEWLNTEDCGFINNWIFDNQLYL
jgi:hypothetical protein